MKTIFITGGVTSSLGKGVVSASLGALLEARGYKVRLKKMDPYLNVDPGTMSPFQHGEVFVTDDGTETDLDLGHYERFTTVNCSRTDSISAGRIYWNVLSRERAGGYLGKTVQVIPHITGEIKDFIPTGVTDEDFLLVEIGGTVGDIEATPFLEAVRQYIREKGRDNTMVIHLTLLPYLEMSEELKTKPTQYSVRELQSLGINPDLLLCRSSHPIGQEEKEKIALFCNVDIKDVVAGYDAQSLYTVPLEYHAEGLDDRVMHHFKLDASVDLARWEGIREKLARQDEIVNIAFVGKYNVLKDAYKSIIESFTHAGIALGAKVNLIWLESSDLENGANLDEIFKDAHGILVGPGFGERGIEGKIKAVQYAREKGIPFFGICLGMQMAVIEASRNLLGITDATSSEMRADGTHVVGLMNEWERDGETEVRGEKGDLGGTMRLGAYPCILSAGSKVQKLYGSAEISERHRHRYEVNHAYIADLEKVGLKFSGMSPDGKLPEIVEREDHPWFVAVQFHPELKSRLFTPAPLFLGFVEAGLKFAKGR